MVRFLAAGALALTLALLQPRGRAQVPEFPPHGWSIAVGKNSFYLRRPDLRHLQVGIVDDVRDGLSHEEKFESAKKFFAERAKCPELASAQTVKSFAGFSATDHPDTPRCYLLAMGHWTKDGLQIALISNTKSAVGPKPDTFTFEAIVEDVAEMFMVRYMSQERGENPNPTVQKYANSIPVAHKPVEMMRLSIENNLYLEALESLAVAHGTDGPTRRDYLAEMLLFRVDQETGVGSGTMCADWDPSFFAPGVYMQYHARNGCKPFAWRSQPGAVGDAIEVRRGAGAWTSPEKFALAEKEVAYGRAGRYRPFRKGGAFDLTLGESVDRVRKVAAGELPYTALGPRDIALTADGRFMLGRLESSTLVGEETQKPVQGAYYFDGHTVTLLLDGGRVVHGFAGWVPFKEESAVPIKVAVNINGVLYYSVCPEGMGCW